MTVISNPSASIRPALPVVAPPIKSLTGAPTSRGDPRLESVAPDARPPGATRCPRRSRRSPNLNRRSPRSGRY